MESVLHLLALKMLWRSSNATSQGSVVTQTIKGIFFFWEFLSLELIFHPNYHLYSIHSKPNLYVMPTRHQVLQAANVKAFCFYVGSPLWSVSRKSCSMRSASTLSGTLVQSDAIQHNSSLLPASCFVYASCPDQCSPGITYILDNSAAPD